jgi:hypothetical protein
VLVSLELETDFPVENTEVAIPTARDGFWHYDQHLLSNDADIVLVAAVVFEAIVIDAVRETAERNDIVFQDDIGAAAAATSSAATAAAAAATTATETTTAARADCSATPSGETRAPAGGVCRDTPAGPEVSQAVTSAAPRWPLSGAWSLRGSSCVRAIGGSLPGVRAV